MDSLYKFKKQIIGKKLSITAIQTEIEYKNDVYIFYFNYIELANKKNLVLEAYQIGNKKLELNSYSMTLKKKSEIDDAIIQIINKYLIDKA